MVGIKVAWYLYEMEFHTHGLRMGWYGFTRNMKEVDYEELVCDIYIYICVCVCVCVCVFMLNPS